MYYDVGDSEALLQAVRIKIEFLAPRVVQAKFREIAKTITKPRFSIFLAISRTPKKMSEPGVIIADLLVINFIHLWFFGYFYGKPGSKSLKALLCRHFIENMETIVYNPCPVRVLLSSILNYHKRDARAKRI